MTGFICMLTEHDSILNQLLIPGCGSRRESSTSRRGIKGRKEGGGSREGGEGASGREGESRKDSSRLVQQPLPAGPALGTPEPKCTTRQAPPSSLHWG